MTPTVSPTSNPTLEPSGLPTSSPTSYPTTDPTSIPTKLPTGLPSPLPTEFPTSAPLAAIQTSKPTLDCNIEVNVNCTLPNGRPCSEGLPAVFPCTGRPSQMGMLLRGGFCNQSDNVQPDKFFCTDHGKGPPPQGSQESVYVVVTDAKGKGRTYFQGVVREGTVFSLEDGGLDLEADSTLKIYSDSTRNELLQNLTFHSSCSQNLRLKDTFGAVQLVQWFNEEQGNVTCFADVQFDLQLSLPFQFGGDSFTIESFFIITNFASPPTLDLTNQVQGKIVSKDTSIPITLNSTFDLTVRREYEIISAIQGTSNNNDALQCTGFDQHSFFAGAPAPPFLPTLVPTGAPSVTPQPTPDPDQTPCKLEATIRCGKSAVNRRLPAVECRDLRSPKQLQCRGSSPTELYFLYTGRSCKDSTAFKAGEFECMDVGGKGIQTNGAVTIVITDEKGETEYFRDSVFRGELIQLGPTDKKIAIQISAGENGNKQSLLQTMKLRTDCKSDKTELVVSAHYGALQLDGFTNSLQGEQKALQELGYSFVIQNTGWFPATVLWANRTSLLLGQQSNISPPGRVLARGESLEFNYPFTLNLVSAEGESYDSTFSVAGVGTTSGLACSSQETYDFSVALPQQPDEQDDVAAATESSDEEKL